MYSIGVKKTMQSEIHETQRKIAWNILMSKIAVKNEPNYFTRRKGTEAPSTVMQLVENRTDHICEQSLDMLKLMNDNVLIKDKYTLKFWRRSFKELTENGRFIACDKNLGVRFITHEYYNKLACRELANYETIITDATSHEILSTMQRNLRDIAAAITAIADYAPSNKFVEKPVTENRCIFLLQLAKFIKATCAGDIDTNFKLPKLRMTLKVHKPDKNGLTPTRPIIPTCGLPNFVLGQWLGRFMARMARQIPWNLECSEDFTTWITDRSRNPRVALFDFSNLYGTEPVHETLWLFNSAVEQLDWNFDDITDKLIFDSLRTPIVVPARTGLIHLTGERCTVFTLILAELIRCTIAELDVEGENVKVVTCKFLAMGCPPVAPLSIISLAYLEIKNIGGFKCMHGMKRYIDDIIIDTSIITEEELRRAYPSYLTLNIVHENHYLDVSFAHDGLQFVTWPYVKEHAIVPLNYFSFHPTHTLRAAAKNELVRLMKRTTLQSVKPEWVQFWFVKYSLADYPDGLLRNIIKEVISDVRIIKAPKERGINHVETWKGTNTGTSAAFALSMNTNVSTAWKTGGSLLSIALKAHIKDEKRTALDNTNTSTGTLPSVNLPHIDFTLSLPQIFQDKKTPEDGSSVQGKSRKASGSL